MVKVLVLGTNEPIRELSESSNQTVFVLSTPMPEICTAQLGPITQFGKGTRCSVTPLLVPFTAELMTNCPILASKPSVHHTLPEPSNVIRCGVSLFTLPTFVTYSAIFAVFNAPFKGGVKRPIRATALLLSVNQIEPVVGSGPLIP